MHGCVDLVVAHRTLAGGIGGGWSYMVGRGWFRKREEHEYYGRGREGRRGGERFAVMGR